MGTSMMYQALPEQNTLFDYLRSNQKSGTLFTILFPYGKGIFHFGEIDEDERDEILDGIAEEKLFSSRTEVDQVINELRTELEHIQASHPGVANRTAYLEKSQTIIQEMLLEELKQRAFNVSNDLIEKLLYGDVALMPQFFNSYDEQLYLVPSLLVKEGAGILREIEPRNLFKGEGNPERYYREDFEQWKAFYLQASENEEVVLVYAA